MIPPALRGWLIRVPGWFRRAALDADMDEEFREHLALAAEAHERRGLSPDEARRAARREFGNALNAREAHRAQRGLPALDSGLQDVALAMRRLRHAPLFTSVAVVTLALGIGANTAVFSMLHAALLRTLPVPAPDQLVRLATRDGHGDQNTSFSYPMFRDLRAGARVFSGIAAIAGAPANIVVGGVTEQVPGELVSGTYFDMLGVAPAAGRLFSDADDRTPGAHPVVVLSHGFWQRRFGADPRVVGSTVIVNGHPMTIVGVSAEGFAGTNPGQRIDLRVPMAMATTLRPFPPNRMENPRQQWLSIVARLDGDVTAMQAEAALAPLYATLRETELAARAESMSDDALARARAWQVTLLPAGHGTGRTADELGRPLLFLQGVSALVLLMACANIANMLLARNAARRREVAVRVALGAGRRRLIRQWLTESLVLAVFGAIAGLPLAWAVPAALHAFAPADAGDVFAAPVNLTVLAVTFATATLTGLLAGLAPAVQLTRETPSGTLRGETPAVAGGDRIWSLRGGLVLLQIALAVPLLGASALFVHSLRNLYEIDPGFTPRQVVLASLTPSLNGYSQERLRAFYREVVEAARGLDGVSAASLASDSALSGGWDRYLVGVEGYVPRDGENMAPNAMLVSPHYFGTLGMPLVAGRDFSPRDAQGSPLVAVVNERMARYYFGTANPLGKRLTLDPGPGAAHDIEIVGVVRDAKYVDLREETPRHVYFPLAQEPRVFDLTLHVRTDRDPEATIAAIRSLVAGIDRHVPVAKATTLDDQLAHSLGRDRLVAWLAGVAGVLALGLAAVGLAGVVGFSVARRTREMGVRIALGARGSDVVRLILAHAAITVAGGTVAGALLAFVAAGALEGLLYDIDALDALGGGLAAVAVLIAVSALAAWIPARHAARIAPATALRCD